MSCSDLPRATDEPGDEELYDQEGHIANFEAKHQDSRLGVIPQAGLVCDVAMIMGEHSMQTMHLAMLMMTMLMMTTTIGYGTAAFMHGMKREKDEGLDRDLNMADQSKPETWAQRVRRAARHIANMWSVPR